MKKRIRLTESDLHYIIEESVKKVLNEMSPEKVYQAYVAAQDKVHTSDNPGTKWLKNIQAKKFKDYADKKWREKYDLIDSNNYNKDYLDLPTSEYEVDGVPGKKYHTTCRDVTGVPSYATNVKKLNPAKQARGVQNITNFMRKNNFQ